MNVLVSFCAWGVVLTFWSEMVTHWTAVQAQMIHGLFKPIQPLSILMKTMLDNHYNQHNSDIQLKDI